MSDEQILNPNFHLPPGVKDVRFKTPEEFEVYYDPESETEIDEDTEEFSGADEGYGDDDFSDDESELYPPDYMTIVGQTVRTLPGGGQVVDVTIELPDLEDGNKYDVRLTK